MPVLSRVLDNTPHSDGSIVTVMSISVAGGYSDRVAEARVKTKAKNRALLHNGYDKAWSEKGVGNVAIEVTKLKETDGRFGYRTYRVITKITGAGPY
jgi:hypothetical protein